MRKLNLNKDANERYLAGDKISVVELRELYSYYNEVADLLLQLGTLYHLAFKETNMHAIRLGDYGRARGLIL